MMQPIFQMLSCVGSCEANFTRILMWSQKDRWLCGMLTRRRTSNMRCLTTGVHTLGLFQPSKQDQDIWLSSSYVNTQRALKSLSSKQMFFYNEVVRFNSIIKEKDSRSGPFPVCQVLRNNTVVQIERELRPHLSYSGLKSPFFQNKLTSTLWLHLKGRLWLLERGQQTVKAVYSRK